MLRSGQPHPLLPLLLIPFAALLAVHPLLAHGVSCGQDLTFHIQSWLDAATQLRHGQYPHWAFTPAWHAGEPRFLFYPPLSWLLGALLISVFPASLAPTVYIFLALTAAGFAMYHLARHFVAPHAALLAAALYLANPYILFCAFERAAFAELLAAAWIPLLLLAVLRERPTVRGIAIPIALLWLTNAPAAVMGCYAFALLAALRVLLTVLPPKEAVPVAPHTEEAPLSPLRLTVNYLLGTVFGLALPAYYLIPAAYERRFIQVAMAIIPNMRAQDNFLFTHTTDAAHNAVNQTASTLALAILIPTVALLITLLLRRNFMRLAIPLAALTALIALLLTPISLPLWLHLPNLQFLQFPWRLLAILSAILAFAFALLLDRLLTHTAKHRLPSILYPLSSVFLVLALTVASYRLYTQTCDTPDLPTTLAALYNTDHGAPPTDEYTPIAADNDVLRTDNPGYWLAATPTAAAPHTTPTAAELNPNIQTDDIPVPEAQTLSAAAPTHYLFNLPHATTLILNLRDYPSWRVVCNGLVLDKHLPRPDGLLAVTLPAGESIVDVRWHTTPDQTFGLILSVLAFLLLAVQFFSKSGL